MSKLLSGLRMVSERLHKGCGMSADEESARRRVIVLLEGLEGTKMSGRNTWLVLRLVEKFSVAAMLYVLGPARRQM